MKKINWCEDYSVGHPRMDEQHKQMANLINEIIDHHHANAASEFISELLTKLTDYCLYHLGEEEELLKKHDYPHFDEHIQSHNDFRYKVVQFCSATSVQIDILPSILAFLVGWWEGHITEEDKQYKPYVQENKS